MATKIHPELAALLKRPGTTPIQAIVQLRPSGRPDDIPSPEDSAKLAESVLGRVAAQVGHAASRANVMRYLSSVALEADPEFLMALFRQPEVISAIPNVTAESPFIPPKKKRQLKR